ncbi:hypothetical protein BGZ49_008100 [Haplosporangium sp. Z 27]|nr:hypothetical protein BGZ49_008100 [Haplosporangium sp. Z 27]
MVTIPARSAILLLVAFISVSFMTCATADLVGDVVNNFRMQCTGDCPDPSNPNNPNVNPCGCLMEVRAPTIHGVGGIPIPLHNLPCCESDVDKVFPSGLILPPFQRVEAPNGGYFKNNIPVEITIDRCDYRKSQ